MSLNVNAPQWHRLLVRFEPILRTLDRDVFDPHEFERLRGRRVRDYPDYTEADRVTSAYLLGCIANAARRAGVVDDYVVDNSPATDVRDRVVDLLEHLAVHDEPAVTAVAEDEIAALFGLGECPPSSRRGHPPERFGRSPVNIQSFRCRRVGAVRRFQPVAGDTVVGTTGRIEFDLGDGVVFALDAGPGDTILIDDRPWSDPFPAVLSQRALAVLRPFGTWQPVDVAAVEPFDRTLGTTVGSVVVASDGKTAHLEFGRTGLDVSRVGRRLVLDVSPTPPWHALRILGDEYFMQDHDLVYADTPDGVIEVFVLESGDYARRQAVEEITDLLGRPLTDGELGTFWYETMHAHHMPEADYPTYRAWFEHVRKILRASPTAPPATP